MFFHWVIRWMPIIIIIHLERFYQTASTQLKPFLVKLQYLKKGNKKLQDPQRLHANPQHHFCLTKVVLGEDIVRTLWRHKERGRNACANLEVVLSDS